MGDKKEVEMEKTTMQLPKDVPNAGIVVVLRVETVERDHNYHLLAGRMRGKTNARDLSQAIMAINRRDDYQIEFIK